MGGSNFSQCRQVCVNTDTLEKGDEIDLTTFEVFGDQSLECDQQKMDSLNPSPHPAQGSRQIDVYAQFLARCLQGTGLLDGNDNRLHLRQGAGQARRQTVRQQTECAVSLWAVPTGNVGSWRGGTLIGAISYVLAPADKNSAAVNTLSGKSAFSFLSKLTTRVFSISAAAIK